MARACPSSSATPTAERGPGYRVRPGDRGRGALRTEWLLADGCGGFAMGTALGANTRRYHGLLVAAVRPPLGRHLLLHSAIEHVDCGAGVIELSTQCFGERAMLHPQGWRSTVAFELRPGDAAAWTIAANGFTLTRTVSLRPGEARIVYEIAAPPAAALFRVRVLAPLRDFHGIDREAAEAAPDIDPARDGGISLRRGDVRALLVARGGRVRIEPQWWRDLAYVEDRDRGQEWREDVFSPGVVEAELRRGEPTRIEVAMALEPPRCPVRTASRDAGDPGHSFVVHRARDGAAGASIIAGYPWFADWGRDAMIALPGLLLRTGRCAEAALVLRTFAAHLRNGLLPNCFDDGGAGASYNGADSSLWFVRAVRATAAAADDMDLSDLVDACRVIVRAYQAGTDYGIRVDDEGLVVADARTASGDDLPVTWMDARRGGVTFTSRAGRPIELSALWHHAQLALADMAGGAEAGELRVAAARTASSIRARFWWPEHRCLHDVVCGSAPWGDGRMRPNQIFAVSLAPSPLDPAQQRDVVAAVTARLLTPFGLRTLDPDDPAYRGRFEGDLMQRDGAYHNGTVWPWLIGAWGEAVLRTEDFAPAARDRVRAALAPLLESMEAAGEEGGCLGQIAEVYDGDPPHRPGGCPAQAWSVAEVLRLRALLES